MAHELVLVMQGMALLAYTNTPSLRIQGLSPHLELSDVYQGRHECQCTGKI